MKYIVIALALFGFYKFFLSNYLVSLPEISMTASELTIGGASPNRARFVKGALEEVSGAVVDYQFNSSGFGNSFLERFGARGTMSTLPPQEYKNIVATHKDSGQCMASLLNDSTVEHLELIPKNNSALSQMRRVNFQPGTQYHLRGNYLILKDATYDGHPFSLDMGGGHFFLVESITKN